MAVTTTTIKGTPRTSRAESRSRSSSCAAVLRATTTSRGACVLPSTVHCATTRTGPVPPATVTVVDRTEVAPRAGGSSRRSIRAADSGTARSTAPSAERIWRSSPAEPGSAACSPATPTTCSTSATSRTRSETVCSAAASSERWSRLTSNSAAAPRAIPTTTAAATAVRTRTPARSCHHAVTAPGYGSAGQALHRPPLSLLSASSLQCGHMRTPRSATATATATAQVTAGGSGGTGPA